MSKKKSEEKRPTGPKPDRVKIDMPWEEAVGRALKKKPPKNRDSEEKAKK